MVTRSRKRRCRRVLTTLRNQVAVAETARASATPSTSVGRFSSTPLPSSMIQSARSALGSAASCDRPNDSTINRGSCRYPSLQSRHIDANAGGSASGIGVSARLSGEDVIRHALLVLFRAEAPRLQIEHGPIAPAARHQLIVRT